MGFIMVVSLPVMLVIIIVAIACYLVGRARGCEEVVRLPQYYGPPAPPSGVISQPSDNK